jgi:hypothetical protein
MQNSVKGEGPWVRLKRWIVVRSQRKEIKSRTTWPSSSPHRCAVASGSAWRLCRPAGWDQSTSLGRSDSLPPDGL